MTCKDCVYYDVCRYNDGANEWCKHPEKCEHFKDKSRFAELPCKVGQTVWRIVKEYNGKTRVIEGEVFEITVTHEYGQKFEYRFYFWAKGEEFIRRNYSLWCDFEVFGKTVFLTKEEAEEALKGGEG